MPERRLSQIGRIFPQGIKEQGLEERTFMPKYGMIAERSNQLHEMIRLSGMNVIIDDTDHPLIIKVATLQQAHFQVYFIYNEDYFASNRIDELEMNCSPVPPTRARSSAAVSPRPATDTKGGRSWVLPTGRNLRASD